MAQHGLQFLAVEPAHDARSDADDGGPGAAARREGVGDVALGDADLGLRHVGQRAEAVHDRMQLRCLLLRDHTGVHREQGDLVGEVVLGEQQATGDDDDHPGLDADGQQRPDEHDVEQAEQEDGDRHPGREAGILRVSGAHEPACSSSTSAGSSSRSAFTSASDALGSGRT